MTSKLTLNQKISDAISSCRRKKGLCIDAREDAVASGNTDKYLAATEEFDAAVAAYVALLIEKDHRHSS